MDLELHGSGGNSNNSDDIDGDSAVTKIVPNLWVVTFLWLGIYIDPLMKTTLVWFAILDEYLLAIKFALFM